jgi:hypothetical protein
MPQPVSVPAISFANLLLFSSDFPTLVGPVLLPCADEAVPLLFCVILLSGDPFFP